MQNAVVYARYSSHNQTENSIEGQVAAAKAFAQTHGLNIIHIYADRAKTGTNDQREEFQQMLRDAKSHKFSVVICWKVDRIGRNREEITFNKYKLKKEGVRVEYVAETLGEGNEAVILESVLEGMAEYFSKQLSTNVKRGKQESREKRHFLGGPVPKGYKVVDHKYQINEEEAEDIRGIFRDYANGLGCKKIGDKYHVSPQSVYATVKNPHYYGHYECAGVVYEDYFPAIVDKALWEKANTKIKRQVNPHHRSGVEFYLTGKMFTPEGTHYTGHNATGGHGNKYKYYTVRQSGYKRLRKEAVEQIIVDAVRELFKDDELVDAIWDVYNRDIAKVDDREIIEKKISSVNRGIENLVKSVEEGAPFSFVKDRLEELENEKAGLESELEKTEVKISSVVKREDIETYVRSFERMESHKQIIELFVDRVIVHDNADLEIKTNIIDSSLNLTMPSRLESMRTIWKKYTIDNI